MGIFCFCATWFPFCTQEYRNPSTYCLLNLVDNCRHVKKKVFQFALQLNIKNDIVVLSTTKYLLYLLKQLCITKVYRERPKIHADGDILLLQKK